MTLLKQQFSDNKLATLSAVLMGFGLPLMFWSRGIMFGVLGLGLIFGLLSMRGHLSHIKAALNTPLAKSIGLMLIAFFLCSIQAVNPERSFDLSWQMSYMALTTLALYVLFADMAPEHLRLAWQSLVLSTILACLVVIFDAVVQLMPLSEFLHGHKATQYSRWNFMSSVLCVLAPLVWGYVFKNVKCSFSQMLVVILTIWTIFIAGGRAGWVGLIAALFAFVVLIKLTPNMPRFSWGKVLLTILATATGPFLYAFAHGAELAKNRLNITPESSGLGSGRLDIWQFAIERMGDNPLTGIGLGNFRFLPLPPDHNLLSNAHPHNFMIQIALETGLLGSVVFGAFLVTLVLFLWQRRTTITGLATGCAALAFFVAALTNTSIFQAWWLLFLPMVCMFGTQLKRAA